MPTYRVANTNELAKLADDWNRLAEGIPFRRWEWLSSWWQSYEPAMTAAGRQVELYTLCVVDGDELIAVAPWYVDRSKTAGSVVRSLGSGEVCSDYLGVLCQPDRRAQIAVSLADWLAQASVDSQPTGDCWDTLELDHVAARDESVGLLVEQLRQRGAVAHCGATDRTWAIELPPTIDGYLALLSKSHRKQLRQLQRRYLDSGRAVLRAVEHGDQISTGWQMLTELHQRRLESQGRPGCFQSETFTRFHRAATEALFRAGCLRLYWLEFEGQPVAAEFQLAGESATFAYQGGIEPTALEHEPGRLITFATLAKSIQAGHRIFDFCRGDEPYKAHFRATPRDNVTWRIVSNRPTARLRHRIWIAREVARNWAKSSLQLAAGRNK